MYSVAEQYSVYILVLNSINVTQRVKVGFYYQMPLNSLLLFFSSLLFAWSLVIVQCSLLIAHNIACIFHFITSVCAFFVDAVFFLLVHLTV